MKLLDRVQDCLGDMVLDVAEFRGGLTISVDK